MSAFKTTLLELLDHGPCYDPRDTGLLPADFYVGAAIDLERIIEAIPVTDAIWCLRAFPDHAPLWRHFAVDCAERVKDRMTDGRSLNALAVARRHAQGLAGDDELAEAEAAAEAAWAAAGAAAGAEAEAAARAAGAAVWAAWAEAGAEAEAAAWAAWAAEAEAEAAAGAAACAAAWAHERTWQKERLLFLVRQGYWTPGEEVMHEAA